jgi:hypothetical protein
MPCVANYINISEKWRIQCGDLLLQLSTLTQESVYTGFTVEKYICAYISANHKLQ